MEILNAAWLAELDRLCKGRIAAKKASLDEARNEPERELVSTDDGYAWKNHMGTVKYYSTSGMKALEDFVKMYENDIFKDPQWECKITNDMWRELAMALYYGDIRAVYAGITFPDVRDYIFMKMLGK